VTPLDHLLMQRIAADGPISVAEFMGQALAHPEHGYYRHRDPFGAGGDFTTAPEISQMFGELIGLWCAVTWQAMGAPTPIHLVELGPGRGTLMADLLRAARRVPDFRQAIRLHLVETSPTLRARQAQTLSDAVPTWHDHLATVPHGPLLLVANEFFDALPIRQFVRRRGIWRERLVGLDAQRLAFVDGPAVDIAAPVAEDGQVFEINEPARSFAAEIGYRLAADHGAALLIDYGHAVSAPGDTLQAVHHHAYAPILEAVGEADLTAHVDFQAVAEAARPAMGHGPVTQGAFLRALGLEARTERLIKANPMQTSDIIAACRRLIDPEEMGTLFKVLALSHPDLPPPPGFIPC
jgi:NADH dehydrogenase [ubiquinone] 1 alpha subcomplex assembly factor 7